MFPPVGILLIPYPLEGRARQVLKTLGTLLERYPSFEPMVEWGTYCPRRSEGGIPGYPLRLEKLILARRTRAS